MSGKRILLIGYGVLAGRVLDALLQEHPESEFLVAGRDERALSERINLARYAALNRGSAPTVAPARIDLLDVAGTASVIAEFGPDIVFNATSLLPWWQLDQLPPPLSREIKAAGSGIWAATDLLLPLRLSQALQQAGFRGLFVNASFADLVNPIIFDQQVGPVCGIGNVANAVPGLTLAAARILDERVSDVRIRFVAHHYLSYNLPSTGVTDGAPCAVQILLREQDVSERVPLDDLFQTMATRFRRVKGLAGQLVTASSAVAVLNALINGDTRYLHAPGVHGRAGGYPIQIRAGEVRLDLPPWLDPDSAEKINSAAAAWDGIHSVSPTAGVRVTDASADVAHRLLGYDANDITVANCEDKAFELIEKFERLRAAEPSRG